MSPATEREHRPFGVGTFERAASHRGDGGAFAGLVVDDVVHDLAPHWGAAVSTLDLLTEWDDAFPRLQQIAAGLDARNGVALAAVRPLPPVASRQVLCAGANYFHHVQQITFTALKASGEPGTDEELRDRATAFVEQRRSDSDPFLFAALPTALSGARDDIVLWGPGTQHDWELELAVVIGRPARFVSVDEAWGHIAGYTISNDISVRDVMYREGMPMTDFISTKIQPTFFPTGPYFVPREFVPDPRALRIRLDVNGERMQDESCDDIIYGVPELVSYASRLVPLLPGDLLLTGSPAGNAGAHGFRWLRPGDVIDAEITGLGVQHTACVAPPEQAARAAEEVR